MTDDIRIKQANNAQRIANENITKSLFGSDFSIVTPKTMLSVGGKLRDKLFEYPIIPGAMWVYQQLVSSREWVISGHPRTLPRAVEFIQKAQAINTNTGFVEYGFENVLKRMALDFIAVGRITLAVSGSKSNYHLEYLDPVRLSFDRSYNKNSGIKGVYSNPVKPNDTVWRYVEGVTFKAKDVVVSHSMPIGDSQFIAPFTYLLPVANLAWLIQQHDTAALDGRKIRDILLVGNASIENAIRDAINTQIALWSGANPEEVGIPVIQVNNLSGGPISNNVSRLGISEIPEAFNRTDFIFYYVNQIASVFGLALRHFWNDERTTNKALEVVQEQRQQQKGPAYFVRSMQRLINSSGFLDTFTHVGKVPKFGFIEEVDTNSLLERAEVMKSNSEALEKLVSVFGAYIDPEDYFAWMQSVGVFPYELKLSKTKRSVDAVNPDSFNTIGQDGVRVGSSEPLISTSPSSISNSSSNTVAGRLDSDFNPADNFKKELDYDEITMDSNGHIVDRRRKVFSIHDVIRPLIAKELELPDFNL